MLSKKCYFILSLHCGCRLFFLDAAIVERPIVVIIPSYRNVKIARTNLDSIFNQNYTKYRVFYISNEDLLPDSNGTGALVERYVKEKKQKHRFTLIKNKDRQLALRNWYKTVLSYQDDKIVISLHGDDELTHPNALLHANKIYSNEEKKLACLRRFSGNLQHYGIMDRYNSPVYACRK